MAGKSERVPARTRTLAPPFAYLGQQLTNRNARLFPTKPRNSVNNTPLELPPSETLLQPAHIPPQ